jgi:hypothetical protein
MITRRSLTFLVLALALVAPVTAHADKAKPKSSGPKILITMTDGAQNKLISPTVTTTFAPPKGTTAAAACKGKIAANAPLGKKIVKKRKITIYVTKKSSIKNVAGVCTATSVLKLPDAFLGKTLKFTVSFKGNDAVKKFTKSTKFLLAVPPVVVPPTPFVPTSGPWTIRQSPFVSPAQSWAMTIGPGGTVASIKRFSDIDVSCNGAIVTLHGFPSDDAAFDSPFAITTADVTATDHFERTSSSSAASDATTTFSLHFDSAGHATGTFRLTGSLVGPTGALVTTVVYSGCDTGPINIELAPGEFA